MSEMRAFEGLRLAILIPCGNEAATIGAVVRGFREALPDARVHVFDNNSTDDTARVAAHARARVFRESRQGRDSVVRRMGGDIDADIYVTATGDGTCDPADAPSLVNALVTEHVDMVVGTRRSAAGARMLDRACRALLGPGFTDAVSGYRAVTRRFVKSFPAVSTGLGIETEMSVHAGQLMIPVAEMALDDGRRPDISGGGSRTAPGGWRMLATFLRLVKATRPFAFCVAIACAFAVAGLALMAPAAFLASAMLAVAALALACGLILDAIGRARIEQKRILFLGVPPLPLQ